MAAEKNQLADYWRNRINAVNNDPLPSLIRSLKGTLTTIRDLARDAKPNDCAEDLKAILFHARLGIGLEPIGVKAVVEKEQETDTLF